MTDPRKLGPAQPHHVEKPEQRHPDDREGSPSDRPGPAIDSETPDQSEADHSPARRKDKARDEPRSPNSGDAGPDEDTYD